jgi:hypothetical protein
MARNPLLRLPVFENGKLPHDTTAKLPDLRDCHWPVEVHVRNDKMALKQQELLKKLSRRFLDCGIRQGKAA